MEDKSKSCSQRIFFCVDYPGLVENEKEAIKTLGGMSRIEQSFQKRNAKLLLNFNPENIFSKSLCSTQLDSQNQPFRHSANLDQLDEPEKIPLDYENQKEIASFASKSSDNVVSMPCFVMSLKKSDPHKASIIGRCDRIYIFQKMADFQYLPMNTVTKTNNSSNQSSQVFEFNAFYDQFRFNTIDNYEQDLRRNQIPQLFILPPFFSRFDDPVSYSFKSENQQKSIKAKENEKEERTKSENTEKSEDSDSDDEKSRKSKDDGSSGLIKSMRQERSSLAYLITYHCKQIPNRN